MAFYSSWEKKGDGKKKCRSSLKDNFHSCHIFPNVAWVPMWLDLETKGEGHKT
jgi:hypothetical protein